MPLDGHFNPMTGLADYLRNRGHDLRFYTGPTFATRLSDLGIPHLPFVRATDLNAENLVQHYPEYEKLGVGPKAIEFAITKIFFGNLEAHYRDICEIHRAFPFEAFVCDAAFGASHLVAQKLQPRSFALGPAPSPAPSSKTAPPPMFGLKPAKTLFGRLRDRLVTTLVDRSTQSGLKILNDLLAREGLPPFKHRLFDLQIHSVKLFFQSGCPGMDFPRDDFPENYRFVGPLMPAKRPRARGVERYQQKLKDHPTLVVVSQGTMDNRDAQKLFVPTLEALKGTRHLVVATTGGRNTEALRKRFPEDNVVVEDFVDFDALLEDADLFVCNGGYGSVMQALLKGVPLLCAGKLEGKNDINARLDFRGLGLDLKTERPTARQIAAGVVRVLGDASYRANVDRVRVELEGYRPYEVFERHLLA